MHKISGHNFNKTYKNLIIWKKPTNPSYFLEAIKSRKYTNFLNIIFLDILEKSVKNLFKHFHWSKIINSEIARELEKLIHFLRICGAHCDANRLLWLNSVAARAQASVEEHCYLANTPERRIILHLFLQQGSRSKKSLLIIIYIFFHCCHLSLTKRFKNIHRFLLQFLFKLPSYFNFFKRHRRTSSCIRKLSIWSLNGENFDWNINFIYFIGKIANN